MSTEENKSLARQFFAEMDRRKGLPQEMCDAAITLQLAGNPRLDLQGIVQMVGMFYTGFPDLTHSIQHMVAEGDRVVIRSVVRGTHRGDFMGIPPTGKPVEVTLTEIMRVAGGKVAEGEGILDQLGLLQQLGVAPAPQPAQA